MRTCAKAWDDFLEQHPMCAHEDADKVPPGMAGYTAAPFNAWSGWRYRIPGGPVGGQYHGFIASDDIVDGVGWPAGHDEIFRAVDNPAGLGGMPWHGWDDEWGGIPLNEGETVSDYVYRSPAEMRPRANASGGVHTVRAVQTRRSAGYAIAPGNYRGLGLMPIDPFPHACPQIAMAPCPAGLMRGNSGPPCYTPSGPCQPYEHAPGPIRFLGPPIGSGIPPIPPGTPPTICPPGAECWPGTNLVRQPPPPVAPQPGPITATGCPAGQYQDEWGICMAPISPAPAPTVSANTCPTGYSQDPNTGNCLAPGAAPSGSGIMAWLGASTQIGGVNIPNAAIAGVGALIAMKMFGGRR